MFTGQHDINRACLEEVLALSLLKPRVPSFGMIQIIMPGVPGNAVFKECGKFQKAVFLF